MVKYWKDAEGREWTLGPYGYPTRVTKLTEVEVPMNAERDAALHDIIEHVLQKDRPHAHLNVRQRRKFADDITEAVSGYINKLALAAVGSPRAKRSFTPTDRYAWHVDYDGSKTLSRLWMVGDEAGDFTAEWRSVPSYSSTEMQDLIRDIEESLAR